MKIPYSPLCANKAQNFLNNVLSTLKIMKGRQKSLKEGTKSMLVKLARLQSAVKQQK